MKATELHCPSCTRLLDGPVTGIYHAGFSNLVPLYCDSCGISAALSVFTKTYESIAGHVGPTLTVAFKEKLAPHMPPCWCCGGKFTATAPPRCPHCRANIEQLLPTIAYFVSYAATRDPWLERDT